MFPAFFLVQDIQTQVVIRCGTKRKGLHYVEMLQSIMIINFKDFVMMNEEGCGIVD